MLLKTLESGDNVTKASTRQAMAGKVYFTITVRSYNRIDHWATQCEETSVFTYGDTRDESERSNLMAHVSLVTTAKASGDAELYRFMEEAGISYSTREYVPEHLPVHLRVADGSIKYSSIILDHVTESKKQMEINAGQDKQFLADLERTQEQEIAMQNMQNDRYKQDVAMWLKNCTMVDKDGREWSVVPDPLSWPMLPTPAVPNKPQRSAPTSRHSNHNDDLPTMLEKMRVLLSDMRAYNNMLMGYDTLDTATIHLINAEAYLSKHVRDITAGMNHKSS